MDVEAILALVKADLGMTTSFRDGPMRTRIEGIVTELTDEKNITLKPEDANHLMFVVDYAAWRFQSKDSDAGMPEHLRFRLRNLYIHSGGGPRV